MTMKKKAALIILDGWGIGEKDESDGVHQAKLLSMINCLKGTQIMCSKHLENM